MNRQRSNTILFLSVLFLAVLPLSASGDVLGDQQRFFVDSSFDALERAELDAVLRVANPTTYFYVEKTWWNNLDVATQQEKERSLIALAGVFEQEIYPLLRQTFGSEWNPGIDQDPAITVLFHQMRKDAGGYTNSGDGYSRLLVSRSNEREIIYLSTEGIGSSRAPGFLAHEFLHLITFNQKHRLRQVQEETWLNELRAEYAPTLLGYDLNFAGSNLQQRLQDFLTNPGDSLTQWGTDQGKVLPQDYGAINLFAQYLVDQYGVQILVDSLKSEKVGIASLNEALQKGNFSKTFADVFGDWTIALFLNDCSLGQRYCYHNPHLVNLRLVPQVNFLPGIGESTLSFNTATKDWAGNWIKILGGKEVLTVEFQGSSGNKFAVPYVLENMDRRFSLHQLSLDANNRGSVVVPDFNKNIRSVVLLPSAQTRSAGLDEVQAARPFFLVLSASEKTPQEEEALIEQLLAQIEFLKKEIAKIQAQLAAAQSRGVSVSSCISFSEDLFYGLRDNAKVRCLQEFLKSQGQEIYPEGFVTGNFLSLTQVAVIRFQEKYADEILLPLGLEKGTGYVGSLTRTKINSFLSL